MIDAEVEEVGEAPEGTGQSPVPVEEVAQETMTFPEAIAEATNGKRIQRLAWPETEFGYFKDDFLLINREGKDFVWKVSMGDATESDWVTIS